VTHERAGHPARADDLVDVSALVDAYATTVPDLDDPAQQVVFGTSGHRGSSLSGSFNEPHILAMTQAICEYRAGQGITGIALRTRGSVPGITAEQFAEAADGAKVNCPVSQALTGTTITLSAEFVEA